MTMLFKNYYRLIAYFLFIFFLLFNPLKLFSQVNKKDKICFIWNDNSLQASNNEQVYIIYYKNSKADTIFPAKWESLKSDTVLFEVTNYKNPVYLEISSNDIKKQSSKFNLIPTLTYNLIELDDKIEIKPQPIIFDSLDTQATTLYAFLVKLIIELLLAVPLAFLLRLPPRLYFFVFVANIMSFPLVYVSFIPWEYKEILTIILEGFFIKLIGWRRLKLTKALLISLILNVLRFGIAKVVMLAIRII